MNDTGYLIWFIATIIMTVSVMSLGVAASAGAFRRDRQHAGSVRPHLHLLPRHHDQHHHAA